PRHAALDVEEKDKVVGHGHRLLRPRHEHVYPLHAARSCRGVHEETRQDARRIFWDVRIYAQEIRPEGYGGRVSVPQLGVPGRPAARGESPRRDLNAARPTLASSGV